MEAIGDSVNKSKEAKHRYYLRHKAHIIEQSLQWRLNNPEKYERARRKRYLENREKKIMDAKIWRQNNPEKSRLIKKRWLENNPEKRRETLRKSNQKSGAYKAEWQKSKRRSDPTFRMLLNLRTRVYTALKRGDYSKNTMQLLGCSMEDLWIYLESRFQDGMTRENYGKIWHVDHIMPCAIFDLSKSEHQKRCFHFSNLQPLFGKDNQRKAAKVLSDQFTLI